MQLQVAVGIPDLEGRLMGVAMQIRGMLDFNIVDILAHLRQQQCCALCQMGVQQFVQFVPAFNDRQAGGDQPDQAQS